MRGALLKAGELLRRTSGTLRQTEGSRPPGDAPTRRNGAAAEALMPREGTRSAARREIRRPLKHLRPMSEAAGTIRDAAGGENRTADEILAPHRCFLPAPAHKLDVNLLRQTEGGFVTAFFAARRGFFRSVGKICEGCRSARKKFLVTTFAVKD
jgi:hypothetical protein